MSVGAIGAEILGGMESTPPPWYTSLKHPMTLGVNYQTYGWNEKHLYNEQYDLPRFPGSPQPLSMNRMRPLPPEDFNSGENRKFFQEIFCTETFSYLSW